MLPELQDNNKEVKKLGAEEIPETWEDVEEVLHHQELPYVPEIICSELISHYHDGSLAGQFGMDKTRELIARKYYCQTRQCRGLYQVL